MSALGGSASNTESSPIRAVLSLLPDHKKTGHDQWEARCPAHEDSHASLSVSVGQNRAVLLKCHVGCDWREVARALELAPSDLFEPKTKPAQRRQVATYEYRDDQGQVRFRVVRFEPGRDGKKKDFEQHQPNGKGGWIWNAKGVTKVVYRLPELLKAAAAGGEVWLAEGEKDVETLRSKGLVASCNAGGAGKWLPEYSASFTGASAAYIIPDDDIPGRAHAKTLAMSLGANVPMVKVVKLPNGKDATEWFAAGGTLEELKALAAAAAPFSATAGSFQTLLQKALADVIAGANSEGGDVHETPAFEHAGALLDRDFPKTPWLVQGILVERAVSVTAGEPKTAKTWSALEIAMAVASGSKAFGEFTTGTPRPVAVFLVEDDERSTRNRLRALADGRGLEPRAAMDRMFVKCRGRLDLLNDEDLAWLVASCRNLPHPPELLVLDPLRDLHNAKENDSDSMAPVMARLRLLRDLLHCAVVFVHHAAKAGETTNTRRPGQRMRGSGVVHASVDGGIYLSNLETDGASRFESTADVELKSVRGAGQFSLKLDVIDDEGGEAAVAKWTVTRPEKATSKADGLDKAQATLLKALRFEWLNAVGSVRPLSIKTLQTKTGVATATVSAALSQLLAEEKAAQIFKGQKPLGWVYQPKPSEIPTSQQTLSAPFPEQSESMPKDPFPTLYRERVLEPVPVQSTISGLEHGGA